MQLYSAPNLDSLIGFKISQYCSVDMNDAGTEKKASLDARGGYESQ